MNRIDTSFAANGQPFLAPTSLDMLQDAYKDGIRELALAQIGSSYSTSVPYILWGCEEGSSPIVSQGAIFFNGEVLFCAGRGSSGVGTLIASLGIAYPVSDPVTFEDGSTNNIHQIRTCNLTYGTSGTGTIGDFADFVRVNTTSVDYINTAASIGVRTIKMDRNKFLTFNNTGSAASITIDASNAISGRILEIQALSTAGNTIDFLGAAGTTPVAVNVGFPYTVLTNTSIYIRMKAIEVAAATFNVFIEIIELA